MLLNSLERKFIEDKSAQDPPQRLYLTGDLVRRDETGLLHFLGRMDNQIKVNGCRIEPEHVETVLRRHPAAHRHRRGRLRHGGAAPSISSLLSFHCPGTLLSEADFPGHCDGHLPPHMIPARLQMVDEFPLTRTGKIDRLALSRLAANARVQKSRTRIMPRRSRPRSPISGAASFAWKRSTSIKIFSTSAAPPSSFLACMPSLNSFFRVRFRSRICSICRRSGSCMPGFRGHKRRMSPRRRGASRDAAAGPSEPRPLANSSRVLGKR